MDDYTKIQGKIVALGPSFALMSELTGKQPSATVIGLYASHFVDLGFAMHDVNIAVEQIMVAWNKPYWPSAEDIAKKARLIAQSSGNRETYLSRQETLEATFADEDERRWDHRLAMANAWRDASPRNWALFKAIVKTVDSDITRLCDVIRLEWMTKSSYRDAFRLGASVGGCLKQAGIDERTQEKIDAIHRETRAQQFARTGIVEDAA